MANDLLPDRESQRSARNLLAWAGRIMRGEHGKPGSAEYQDRVRTWDRCYRSLLGSLRPMEPLATNPTTTVRNDFKEGGASVDE